MVVQAALELREAAYDLEGKLLHEQIDIGVLFESVQVVCIAVKSH